MSPLFKNKANKSCRCNDTLSIVIDRTQLSRILALVLLCSVSIFLAGYFWGKHYAFDDIAHKLDQDSFADQVYYSMATMHDNKQEKNEDDSSQEMVEVIQPVIQQPVMQTVAAPEQKMYQALLFGGKKQATQALAKRLQDKGYAVANKERVSTSKRGKNIVWYQVVTEPLNNKDAVHSVVDAIKKIEKLDDKIRIVEV